MSTRDGLVNMTIFILLIHWIGRYFRFVWKMKTDNNIAWDACRDDLQQKWKWNWIVHEVEKITVIFIVGLLFTKSFIFIFHVTLGWSKEFLTFIGEGFMLRNSVYFIDYL